MKQLNSLVSSRASTSKCDHKAMVTSTDRRGEISSWLSRHSPAAVDGNAIARASSHGAELRVRYEGRYPRGANGEAMPSYEVATGCEIEGTQAARDAALTDLRNFLTPADIRTIEGWIAELSVLTAGRGREGFDAELMVSAYSARLSQFPADVVRHALLGRTWKWFPTWEELEQVCRVKTAPRKHMIAALSQPEPDMEPARRETTDEERERIAALVAEQFPAVSQEWRDAAVAGVMDEVNRAADAMRMDKK